MAKLLKLRRGTTSQHSSFTGAEGEVTVDTTKDTIVVHDGSTAGGKPLATESALNAIATDLVNDTSPQLGGNLDVNTKNILLGDSSDGAADDVIKFGAGTDLSIYSNGTEGIITILDAGKLVIKQGSSDFVTFSGSANQVDFHEDVVFIGASSNGAWDKSANKFLGNVQGDLTGTATEATNVTVVANNSTDETVYPTFVDGATGTQGIETDTGLTYNPSTGLLTAVGLTLSGNLTVGGTTTTINSTTLTVDDKNIELGSVDTPTDTTADGGGITLKGATDKEIKWVDSTDSWTFNQTIETTGAIKGNSIITSTGSLGVGTHTITSPNSVNRSIHVHNADHSSLVLSDDQNTWEIVSNNDLTVRDGTDTRLTINTTGNATFAGTVSDSKGNLRSIPANSPGSNHVAVAADAGKCIYIAYDVTINPSVFAAGDAVTIVNNSGNDETIIQGSSFTLYNSADASTGNRTLAGRGMATIWFAAHNIGYISGAGLT